MMILKRDQNIFVQKVFLGTLPKIVITTQTVARRRKGTSIENKIRCFNPNNTIVLWDRLKLFLNRNLSLLQLKLRGTDFHKNQFT